MAKAWIKEFNAAGTKFNGDIPLPVEPAIAEQTVTFTTSTDSSAFNDATSIVRIQTDTDGHFAVGTAPAATADSEPIAANTVREFIIAPGQSFKVAFYDGSS